MVEYEFSVNKYSIILKNILSIKNNKYINFKIYDNKFKTISVDNLKKDLNYYISTLKPNKITNKKYIIISINDIIDFYDIVTSFQDKNKIYSRIASLLILNLLYFKIDITKKLKTNITNVISPILNDKRKIIWLLINNIKSINSNEFKIEESSKNIFFINKNKEEELVWMYSNQ